MNREQFEKLPEIKAQLEYCRYSESKNKYVSHWYNTMYINGAWYAWQEQQKKIDALSKHLNKFVSLAVDDLLELLK